MLQNLDLGPVELRYVASLRGIVPPLPETRFHYARLGGVNVDQALCLAASNPEGRFYFILGDSAEVIAANQRVKTLHLDHCHFLGHDEIALPPLDYLCVDLSQPSALIDRNQACALAQKTLRPNGLFVCRYAPFAAGQSALEFMVAEFAPELSPDKADEFLHELKMLGQLYFGRHAAAGNALNTALGSQKPQEFLGAHGFGQDPQSEAVSMIATMSSKGFDFVGDGSITANYLELMVPQPTQEVLYSLRSHLLYEAIKDFATARDLRTDIWVRQPAQMSASLSELFGPLYVGLLTPREALPPKIRLNGQTLDLSTPLMQKLLEVMSILPLTVGDFLSHPEGEGLAPADVVMAMHALIAFGVAAPMRSTFTGFGEIDHHYPRLAGGYNQQYQTTAMQHDSVLLASPVAGRPIILALPEALILQAVGRAGLADAPEILLPELQRIAGIPALSPYLFDPKQGAPAADFAETMVRDICERDMIAWYRLGVLDAA
jgi:hypothetical protein